MTKINRTEPVRPQAFFETNVADTHRYAGLDTPCPVQAQGQMRRREGRTPAWALNYCGRDVVTLELEQGMDADAVVRHHSDGSVQSFPLIQQFFISVRRPCTVRVTLRMHGDARCIRPRRAQGTQAILGQVGHPLIYGANGFYGIWEDLLVEWHNAAWSWEGVCAQTESDGGVSAVFTVQLDTKPFLFVLRPHYYRDHLGYRYHRPWERQPNRKAVCGWCSWEAYHDAVRQEDMARAAREMAGLAPWGLEYIQLDDGYQNPVIPPAEGGNVACSWLTCNDKFTGGHAQVIRDICANGLVPAIWTNVVVTNEQAANNGLCMTQDGLAFRGDWIQFILQCTDEILESQVLPYYQGLAQLGYRYFKSDALRHLFYDGLQECVRRGLLSPEEAETRFRRFYACARRGIGDEPYLLSCWGGLTQAVGIADGCRIATDANPTWWSIQMQIIETARWYFAQRILFTVDPDHICARTDCDWARMLLSHVSLTGGICMLSDDPACYDAPRMQMIKKTIPPLCTYAAETGPLDYTTPAFCRPADCDCSPEQLSAALLCADADGTLLGTRWATHFFRSGRRWTVLLRTALLPMREEASPLADWGLDPDTVYAAYDFWEDRFLGLVRSTIALKALKIGDVQAIALTEIDDADPAPQLIGSTRHVSMDDVSVREYRAQESSRVLVLAGVVGERVDYLFYKNVDCGMIAATGCQTQLRRQGDVHRLTVAFTEETARIELG